MASEEIIIDVLMDVSGVEAGATKANAKIRETEEATGKAATSTSKFGGALSSLINPATVAAAALGGLALFIKNGIDQSQQWTQAMNQVNAVITSTGGAAGVSSQAVGDLASKLSASGGLSRAADDSIASMEAMVLTFTNIHSNVFPQTTQAILDMTTAMNNGATPSTEQLTKSAILVGKALNDPVKGLTALQRVGVTFSEAQKETIATMIKTGDVAGAQTIILNELAKEFGGSALASTKSFGGQMDVLRETMNNVAQSMGDALIPALTSVVSIFTSPDVLAGITDFVDGLADGISKAIPVITAAFQQFGPIVIGVFQRIWTTVSPIIAQIVSWFISVLPAALQLASSVFVGVLLPAFQTVGNIITGYVIPALSQLGNFIGQYLPPIIGALITAWGQLQPALIAVAAFIAGSVVPALVQVGDVIMSVAVPVLQFLAENMGAVAVAIGVVLVPAFVAWAISAGAAALATLAAMAPVIIVFGVVVAAVIALKTAFDNNFLGIRDIVTSVANAVGGILTWLGDTIRGFLNWLGIQMPKSGGDAGSGFINNMNNNLAAGVPTLNANVTGIGGNLSALEAPAASSGAAIGHNFIDNICTNVAAGIPVLNSQIAAIQAGLASLSQINNANGGMTPLTIDQQVHAKELGLITGQQIAPGVNVTAIQANLTNMLENAKQQLRDFQNAAGGLVNGTVHTPDLPSLFGGVPGMPDAGAGAAPYSLDNAPGGSGGKGGGGKGGAGGSKAIDAITAATDMTTKISQAIQAGVAALGQLSNFTIPQGFENGLDQFAAAMNAVMQKMATLAVAFKAELLTQTSLFLDTASKAVGVIGQGVDAFNKLKNYTAPTVGAIDAFMATLVYVLGEMQQISTKWSADAIALTAGFADAAGKVVALVSAGVDALLKLKGFTAPSADAMTAFTNALDFLLNTFRAVIIKWDEGALAAAAAFGESMGKFISGISGAVDTLAKLVSFRKPSDDAMQAFSDAFDYITDKLRTVVHKWSAAALTHAGEFGDGMGKFMQGMGAAFAVFTNLISFRKPSDDAVNAFSDGIDYLTDKLRAIIHKWSAEALIHAGEFGDSMGKLLSGMGQGLTLLQTLGSPAFVEPSRAAIDAFSNSLTSVITDFGERVALWASYATTVTAPVATAVGTVLDGITKGLSLLEGLASNTFKAPAQGAVDAFFSGLTQILDAFAAHAAIFAADANVVTAPLATAVGTVMDGVGKAVAPLVALSTFKAVPTGAIDAFFSGLTTFLQAFASRAATFKSQATDDVAKIAVNIGTIAEALGKVVDPLLKVLGFKAPDSATPNPSVTLMGNTFSVKGAGESGMSAFFDALTTFIQEFASRSSQWVSANDKTVQGIAAGIGTVMGGVGAAIDPLVKLQAFKAPGASTLDAFFNAMSYFIGKIQGLIAAVPETFVANAVAFAAGINQMFGDLSSAMTTAAGIKTPADLPDIFKNILTAIQDVVTYMRDTAVTAWADANSKFVTDAQQAAAAITAAYASIVYPPGTTAGGTSGGVGAGSGGTATGGKNTGVTGPGGVKTNAIGFGNGVNFNSGGSIALNLYLDGMQVSPQQLSQRLGLRARITEVRT